MTSLEMGWGRMRGFDILRITGLLGSSLRKHALHECQTPRPVKLLTRSTFSTLLWVWSGEGISRGDIQDLLCRFRFFRLFYLLPASAHCGVGEAVLVISTRAELDLKKNTTTTEWQISNSSNAPTKHKMFWTEQRFYVCAVQTKHQLQPWCQISSKVFSTELPFFFISATRGRYEQLMKGNMLHASPGSNNRTSSAFNYPQ